MKIRGNNFTFLGDIVAAIFWTKAICYPTSFIALFKKKVRSRKREMCSIRFGGRFHFRYGLRKSFKSAQKHWIEEWKKKWNRPFYSNHHTTAAAATTQKSTFSYHPIFKRLIKYISSFWHFPHSFQNCISFISFPDDNLLGVEKNHLF